MSKRDYDDISTYEDTKAKKKLSPAVTLIIVLITLIIIAVIGLVIINFLKKTPSIKDTINVTPPKQEQVGEMNKEPEPQVVQEIQTPVITEPDFSNTTTAMNLSKTTKTNLDGQVIYQNYTMVEGDTLESVANKFGITLQTILSVNQIKNPSAVVAGSLLQIPDRSGRRYVVEDGDMLSSITRKFKLNMGWKTLQEINGLKSESIKVGQVLFIPDEAAISSPSVIAKALEFKAPVAGTTIAYYGQSLENPVTKQNMIMDGILISTTQNALIKAAASGVVMDIAHDSNQDSFFVKLSHDGNYSTYYYNLDPDSIRVEIGQKLNIGEELGLLKSNSLYFKIEQDMIMLDPAAFF